MKIPRLKIENFMGIGSADLSLSDKGLVLLQGENKDDPSANSNGSAKSSLMDALFWCLYGETARGTAADSVVNRVAGKGCVVTVEVDDDGHSYTIERWRKKKKNGKMAGVSLVENLSPGHVSVHTKGTDTLTQVEINRVLGCSKEVFCAAVYAGQEAMPDLPAMTDRPLKVLIEEAAGITVLEKAYDLARAKASKLERDEAAQDEDVVMCGRTLEECKARTKDLTHKQVDWAMHRDDRVATAKSATANALAEAKKLAVEIKAARTPETIQSGLDTIKSQLDEADAKLNGVKGEQVELERLASLSTLASNKVTKLRAAADRAQADHAAQAQRLNTITGRIGKPCGECGKPILADEIEAASKIASAKLEELRLPAIAAKDAVSMAAMELAQASQAVESYRQSMTDMSSVITDRRRLADAYSVLAGELSGRVRKVDALEAQKRSVIALDARAKEIEAETNPFDDLLVKAGLSEQDAEQALAESEEASFECARLRKVAQDVAHVFGPKGVRAHIIDTVTPFLNDRTAHYLGSLSDGAIEAVWTTITLSKTGEATEKFSIAVEKNGGGSFKDLSGGEKRKVRLASALALQDLVASRASKPIDLWVGDEVDEALDASGLERLMMVLEAKARERGSVIIISHNDIKDWCRQVTTVTMSGGQASAEGVLCR